MASTSPFDKMNSLWPRRHPVRVDELALCDNAVETFPDNAMYWRIRGSLYELAAIELAAGADSEPASSLSGTVARLSSLSPEGSSVGDALIREAIRSLLQAVALEPGSEEVLLQLGVLHDSLDDFTQAESYLRRAMRIGQLPESYSALARVLAQLNDSNGAIRVLTSPVCPFADHIIIKQMRDSIVSGEWDAINDE